MSGVELADYQREAVALRRAARALRLGARLPEEGPADPDLQEAARWQALNLVSETRRDT